VEIETENNVLLLNELSGKAKQFLREVVAVIEVLLQKKKTVNGVVVDITFFFLSFEKKKPSYRFHPFSLESRNTSFLSFLY